MSLSREEHLLEMGLGPLWKLRGADSAVVADATVMPATAAAPQAQQRAPRQERDSAGKAAAAAPAAARTAATDAGSFVQRSAPPADPVAAGEWSALYQQIIDCQACTLCAARQQAVPGVGDPAADWLFIGEGPGAEEDARGEPFVGAAGKLLDAMLAAIDLKRGEDVYIANAVKCRPPNNRTPEAAEIAACRPYLERQVALLQPRLIVLLGRAAVQATLGLDASLASLRGRAHEWEVGGRRIPVIVTYHPAYLLRTPLDKARAWEDLCRARALMRAAKAGSLDNAAAAPT